MEVLKESIMQSGWDTSMAKFIVVPIQDDYEHFLQCLPDATKAFSTKRWESTETEETGFNTH